MNSYRSTTIWKMVDQTLAGNISRETFFEKLTEMVPLQTEATRSSIWFFIDGRSSIICQDLYDKRTGLHHGGTELLEENCSVYFEWLDKEEVIVAGDAHRHPATTCFSESYFKPNGIESLLDAPIIVNGNLIGVFCSEHCGRLRTWLEEDIDLVQQAAAGIARVLGDQP